MLGLSKKAWLLILVALIVGAKFKSQIQQIPFVGSLAA